MNKQISQKDFYISSLIKEMAELRTVALQQQNPVKKKLPSGRAKYKIRIVQNSEEDRSEAMRPKQDITKLINYIPLRWTAGPTFVKRASQDKPQ